MPSLDLDAIERVLVVKLSSLGDVVHATGCLRALRAALPRAEIVMAVDRAFTPVVRCNPHLDGIIESDAGASGKLRRFLSIRRALASCRRPRWDLALDLQGTARSAAWIYLSGARRKTGRGGWRPGWSAVARPDLGRHAVAVCAEVCRQVGISIPTMAPEVFTDPAAERALTQTLEHAGIGERPFLVVNPFSRWNSKQWPIERYAELIVRLAGETSLTIVIAGCPAETVAAAELMSLVKGRAVSFVGKLPLEQSICLYRRATLMVTGDSGPMHLAAALGTRVVALFGPTFPERTGPWGAGHRVIQALRPPTHHTYRSDSLGRHMAAIAVETVHRAVIDLLPNEPIAATGL